MKTHRMSRQAQLWLACGLLLVSVSLILRVAGPASLHTNLGDLTLGLLMGVGLGIEIGVLIKMRRRAARPGA